MGLAEKKKNLIQQLISAGYLKTEKVISAFKSVPRENFVPEEYKQYAYIDEPLPIGGCSLTHCKNGMVRQSASVQTISAPHMVAIMTELLKPKKTDRVLEIGAGSGYQAAILSKLVKIVYTVEFDKNLADFARKNIEKTKIRNVKVFCGDGSNGLPEHAPYDKIIVTCGCPEIPKQLIEQLKTGGRIVIPVGGFYQQELILGIKTKGGLETESHGGCVFVPLRH